MIAKVIGIERGIDYFSRKQQRQVKGTTLYVVYKLDKVDGFACDDIFVSATTDDCSTIEVGKYYDFVRELQFGSRYPVLTRIDPVAVPIEVLEDDHV